MRQWFRVTLAVGLIAASPRAQDVRRLMPGASIERDLSTGQSHTYAFTAVAGDFIHLTIEQRGIDVVVALASADGHVVLSVDASSDDFRPEAVVAVAAVEGGYTVDVRPAPSAGPRGRYAVRIEAVRPARPEDDIRIAAERAFARGRQLRIGEPAQWPAALAALDTALVAFRQLEDRAGVMKVLIELANVQQDLIRPEALPSAKEAERIARALGDRAAIASAVNVVGRASERAGDLPGALRAHEESTAINHAIGNRRLETASLNSEGVIHGRTGNAETAVARFEQALAIARDTNNRRMETSALNNIGIAYRDLGEYEKSLSAYRQSLADTGVAQATRVVILNNMGNLERLLGNDRRALDLHTEALAVSRRIGDRENEARSLNTLGLTHYSLGEYAKALDYHREGLAIRRGMNDLPGQAASLDGAGRAWHRLGDTDQALGALREALAIRQRIREPYGEADTLRNLAAVERDRNRLTDALGYIQSAVDLDDTLRARITSPALRASFVATAQDKYELFIDLLQQRHRADPSGGHDAAAFQVSERARARMLLESLLDARVDLREGIEPALLDRERSLQKQLNDASADISRALAGNRREEQIAAGAEKVERLTADYQQLQAQIRRQSPRYAALTQPQPLAATEIQGSVIDDDTVLLEFALGDDRSWLWAVTPHSITSVELPPRREIDIAARSLYARLTARQTRRGEQSVAYAKRVATADARLVSDAAGVSRMLLGGIARQLNGEWRGKRLAVVATGALELLPFAALPAPDRAPTMPLIAGHEIVTIPSASVLAMLRQETSGRVPAPNTMAILADPVFEGADPRVTVPPAHQTSVSKTRDGWSRLPFSREEANAIVSLTDARGVLKATDFRASRATVLGGALRGHRIVHFATHGVLDSQRPALSGLIFSLVDERGAPLDGFLRLHDIYNMRLDADLVVLSACQTALGKEIKGEGLVGLTRAFMYAGAPRVVASLWQVSDLATAELMKRFYRGILQQKLSAAAALRAAQRQMSQDPRWASPYYWAGFVAQGDWR